MEQRTDVRDRIEAAQLRHREQRRIVKAEDGPQADRAEGYRQETAYPPRPEVSRLRRARRRRGGGRLLIHKFFPVETSAGTLNVSSSPRGLRPVRREMPDSRAGKKPTAVSIRLHQ